MKESSMTRIRRNAARSIFWYALDMAVAITGWVVGFGLHVQNWWALVLLLIASRWVFFTLQVAFSTGDVRAAADAAAKVALRDRFAAHAMQAQLTTDGVPGDAAEDLISAAMTKGRDPIDQLAITSYEVADAMLRARDGAIPIEMVLHCPTCTAQHVDAPEPENGWSNPPHRSHQCKACGTTWRPADVPTYGVEAITTRGKRDSAWT